MSFHPFPAPPATDRTAASLNAVFRFGGPERDDLFEVQCPVLTRSVNADLTGPYSWVPGNDAAFISKYAMSLSGH